MRQEPGKNPGVSGAVICAGETEDVMFQMDEIAVVEPLIPTWRRKNPGRLSQNLNQGNQNENPDDIPVGEDPVVGLVQVGYRGRIQPLILAPKPLALLSMNASNAPWLGLSP